MTEAPNTLRARLAAAGPRGAELGRLVDAYGAWRERVGAGNALAPYNAEPESALLAALVPLVEGIAGAKVLRGMLQTVEWVQPSYNGSPACPWCDRQQHQGHIAGCELRALLVADTSARGGADV